MGPEGPREEQRLATGIPGLDTVLCGGLRKGRMYMVLGLPGAGKTILANQICFHQATEGRRVLYLTLLAESHTDLVNNLQTLSFFDPACVPGNISYLSAFTILEQGGLDALAALVRKEVKAHKASLLVLDGLLAAEELAPSRQALKKFIHGLQVVTSLIGCTTLVLTTGGDKGLRAEHTMVDGLLLLQQRIFGVRTLRELSVRKFRGSAYKMGAHSFEITGDGLTIYPRLESMVDGHLVPGAGTRERAAFGVPGLDTMLQGGVPAGSTTILLGPPGSGKTLLGMSFLAEGARRGEPGHYFAFYDAPERMLAQAAGVGLHLQPLMERGDLEVSFRPPTENILDKLGTELLTSIRSGRVRRIFLDGYEALRRASPRKARVSRFLAALVNECRVREVTLVYTAESTTAFGPEVKFPLKGISMVAENILFLRLTELHSALRRFVAVLKVRNSDYDPSLRELHITGKGLRVGNPFAEGQMLVTGLARTRAQETTPLSKPSRNVRKRAAAKAALPKPPRNVRKRRGT
ncbi:Circadian clock protein KaiC [Corallococcus praedator]|uniref:non-specific serine/threonine protein kinase n=1 Tax=Corallococcus praedator TaxID=2316724 RepID=A0ABX9Q8F9_9BACT|nr:MULTISPECIES: ATPase domain-containing protein [Corallococcus]RKH33152.1 Circadian clock protein KaiC [Corallococcus sp. CA031C]RKH95090.1 Circadian clock protein KaiC [Corallococcus praedator]